jgi:hypothetical protein
MNDNYFDNIAPALEAMAKTFEQYREISKQLAENLISPLIEFQKRIAEITEPLAEFQKNIATIVAPLAEYTKVLSAIKLLGENQFVFWDYISKDFALGLLQAEDVNDFMLEYYIRNDSKKYKETIQACKSNKLIKPYKKLFSQSISAYNRNQYHLAIMGLLSIVDGLLSDISEKSGTHIESRAKAITDKLSDNIELSNDDFSIWFLYSTFTDIIKSIGASAPFYGEEPELLNRHWIMHGRTKKKISQLDYIKIINFIYGILLLNKISNEEMERDNG